MVATVAVQQHFDLEFWDLDYEGDKAEAEKELSANLMSMNIQEHYGVTDVDWDPTGRYVVSSASVWTHQVSTLHPGTCKAANHEILDGKRLPHVHLLRHASFRKPH